MSLDPTEEISKGTEKFPFAMAITSTFFTGSVFLLFNGPLILLLISNKTYTGTFDLISNGLFSVWLSVTQSSGSIFSVTILLLLSFIIGVIITPIERLTVTLITTPLSIIFSKIKILESTYFFTPREMLLSDYDIILAWLMVKPSEKSHWEWELFNYYIYWSIAINSAVLSFISLYLIRSSYQIIEVLIYLVVDCALIGFALLHSIIMFRVHDRYRKASSNSSERSNFGISDSWRVKNK